MESDGGPGSTSTADSALQELPDAVDAVVVKDLCKGVVSPSLLKTLKDRYGHSSQWFVSTKAWNPDWLEILKDVHLRVFIVPQVAVQKAARDGAVARWFTSGGIPTMEALAALDELDRATSRHDRDVFLIALPDEESMIVRERNGAGVQGYYSRWQVVEAHRPGVPMASVLLAFIVRGQMLFPLDSTSKKLETAIEMTRAWRAHEHDRVRHPEDWIDKRVPTTPPFHGLNVARVSAFDWATTRQDWVDANRDRGVVTAPTGKRLQLWRACREVNGYICCVNRKRLQLQRLLADLKTRLSTLDFGHLGCLMLADPGSGKSFLVRRLATELGLTLREWNITQISSRVDLISCFDSISTAQADSATGGPVLVFFDEINSLIEGQHVYDAFLAPLEDGLYVRGEKKFRLAPCVWFFAGTNVEDDGSNKAADFRSQLTLGTVDLRPGDYEPNRKTERVYVGASLLKASFPDVRKVSENVLASFFELPEFFGMRDIRHYAQSFKGVKFGRVSRENIPLDWVSERLGNAYNEWHERSMRASDDLVEIET